MCYNLAIILRNDFFVLQSIHLTTMVQCFNAWVMWKTSNLCQFDINKKNFSEEA